MQQFRVKLKNVPTDAPQVCSSTNSVLNRDQSLSVQDKVLALNNLGVDQHQHKGRAREFLSLLMCSIKGASL
jgi:hypothetical protein